MEFLDLTTELFQKINDGAFQITKNISAKTLEVVHSIPNSFRNEKDGYATVIIRPSSSLAAEISEISSNTSIDGIFSHKLVSDGIYSLRFKDPRKSSIKFKNVEHKVIRHTAICSGVRRCNYSSPFVKAGTEKNFPSFDLNKSKAKSVFFFAQNNFECKKHSIFKPPGRDNHYNVQHRGVSWVFREGKTVSIDQLTDKYNIFNYMNSAGISESCKLPDYIGCSMYGQKGRDGIQKCNILTLPTNLQGTNSNLVDEIISNANLGNFPKPDKHEVDKCPPLSIKFRGKHCPRAIHGYEAVTVEKEDCYVRYHCFVPNDTDEWMVVVGFGEHTHSEPPPDVNPITQRSIVNDSLRNDSAKTINHLCNEVRNQTGRNPSAHSIRKIRSEFKSNLHPFGTDLSALIHEHIEMVKSGHQSYIKSIVDSRNLTNSPFGEYFSSNSSFDKQFSTELNIEAINPSNERIGVVIIMSVDDLLKQAVRRPQIGVDGTFSIVARDKDNLDMELLTIVSKDNLTGKIFSPLRALTSRKTLEARKMVFYELVKRMNEFGLVDPLQANSFSRLTMVSDFETTFSIALSLVLAEFYLPSGRLNDYHRQIGSLGEENPPRNALEELFWKYMECTCYGCDVHAKRICLEKVSTKKRVVNGRAIFEDFSDPIFTWATSTRRVITEEALLKALSEMNSLGPKWKAFSKWLNDNRAARILWFVDFYKEKHNSHVGSYVMSSSNPNESDNARVKSTPEYTLTQKKGLPIVEICSLLQQIDISDYNNITGSHGRQSSSRPLFARSGRKRTREQFPTVSYFGRNVSASEPKRAKRS